MGSPSLSHYQSYKWIISYLRPQLSRTAVPPGKTSDGLILRSWAAPGLSLSLSLAIVWYYKLYNQSPLSPLSDPRLQSVPITWAWAGRTRLSPSFVVSEHFKANQIWLMKVCRMFGPAWPASDMFTILQSDYTQDKAGLEQILDMHWLSCCQ